ncbi:hypothetical protein WT67_32210 [Burkholderia stagnalis]|nr:hypothetical protein WT02_30235 [Burkholderia stagnalis]KVL92427.1 hypothetical protein WT03_00720 [Burkholderia stagnalis]KVM09507.1 hypothetical protein WT04_17370 [Burkholderia stagnalis]KVO44955.1 hypothetical protein WT17_11005 [Burkholderia stagnalis]KVO80280.1 hypothetical protein WT19_03040 [Burkholderia stagnalis]
MPTFIAKLLRRIWYECVCFDAIEVFHDFHLDNFDVRQIEDCDSSSNLILDFTKGIRIFALPSGFFDCLCEESRRILGARADSIDVLHSVDTLT